MDYHTRIRQVVINLLANTVRFTDKGAITLRANQAHGEIIVSYAIRALGLLNMGWPRF
ncbi:MAG: hypothetical protein IPK19_20690 [Chloroflexi bacterium]|nr:hypothetical protein [Chloroflexota bacterium]